MEEDGVCDINPAFEFDAPRYHDFESVEPESPSQTDAWFDTNGPLGETRTTRATALRPQMPRL